MHGDFAERVIREKRLKPGELLDFASNVNPFPPRDLLDFVAENLWTISFYPESRYSDLKEVISETFDWKPEEVVVGNGSIELIRAFFMLSRGTVLIPYPTFTEYERFAKAFGFKIVRARIDEVVEAVKKIKPENVVVCNPNNPTGEFLDYVEELDALAERLGFNLLVDEAFIDFCRRRVDYENAFVVRSLTKILGIPGLRFGYGKFPKKYAERYEGVRDPWNVNFLAKEVAKKFIPKLGPFSRRVRAKIERERTFLSKRLRKLGFATCGDVNFLLVKGCWHADDIFRFLFDRNILVRTCHDFLGLDRKYFRIAVKDRSSNRKLVKNLEVFVEENS